MRMCFSSDKTQFLLTLTVFVECMCERFLGELMSFSGLFFHFDCSIAVRHLVAFCLPMVCLTFYLRDSHNRLMWWVILSHSPISNATFYWGFSVDHFDNALKLCVCVYWFFVRNLSVISFDHSTKTVSYSLSLLLKLSPLIYLMHFFDCVVNFDRFIWNWRANCLHTQSFLIRWMCIFIYSHCLVGPSTHKSIRLDI